MAVARELRAFFKWFDLAADQATPAEIDASIRGAVPFRGTNLWILICATFVASIGLNVNSAAVIIGAMLISPLMGPIMGVGYGAAVNDAALIRLAVKHLTVAVAFSLLTSTLYFLVTPLSGAGSELLARTSPALWDVLIAIFGGLAGSIGVTRRERGNVIPGVAIATALMPPLCTAGFGIANLSPWYALGALYLFAINSVFIATSTLVMIRVMRLPEVTTVNEVVRTRTRTAIAAIVVLTAIPSVYLAYGLVRQELLASRAERFLAAAFPADGGTFVVRHDLGADELRVTVIGEPVTDDRRLDLDQSLGGYGLDGVHLQILQTRRDEVDVEALKKQVTGDLYRDTLVALDEKSRRIGELEQQIATAERSRTAYADIGAELRATYPHVKELGVGSGTTTAGDALLVVLVVDEPLSEEDRARIESWLLVRARVERVMISTTVLPPPADAVSPK